MTVGESPRLKMIEHKVKDIYKESLKNYVLRILADGPSHGYNIIKKIEEVTKGRWKPAAGTLYPLLVSLKEEGLIDVDEVLTDGVKGGKKVKYKLTPKGWLELAKLLDFYSEYKVNIIDYYVVEGCNRLRDNGLENYAEAICEKLKLNLKVLISKMNNC